MKVNLAITFVSGIQREFKNVDFPSCANTEKVRSWFNKSIGFIKLSGELLNVENIEHIQVTDVDFEIKLNKYREKNPEECK